MNALFTWLADPFGRARTESRPLPAPEPLRLASRPMTGFMATLTPQQRAAALAYVGDDTHGDPTCS